MKINQQEFQETIKEEIRFEIQGKQLLEHIKKLEASDMSQQQINEDAIEILKQFGSVGKNLASQLFGVGKEAGADMLAPEKGVTLGGSIRKTIITNATSYILKRTFNISDDSVFAGMFTRFIGQLLAEIDMDDIGAIASGGDKACKAISDTAYDAAIKTLFKEIISVIQKPVQNAIYRSLGIKSDAADFMLSFIGDVGKEGASAWILNNTEIITKLKANIKQKLCHYIKNFDISTVVSSMF